MRVSKVEVNNVKSFARVVSFDLDVDTSMFAFSGKNGSGKSTLLRSIYLVQKAYFYKMLNQGELHGFETEAGRYLNGKGSYIKVMIDLPGGIVEICLLKNDDGLSLFVNNEDLITPFWNLEEPSNIILFVDASKGFSEDTLLFDEIDIKDNSYSSILIDVVMNPEAIFTGVYRQLVKDYVHGRLIPSKPDRLLYFRVASKLFSNLIPNVILKNFSGKHKSGEFVLLGKTNSDERRPLYDVREFSSGEKALLSTLTFLCMSKSVCTLLIDEPENHFHEGLLLDFIGLLHTISENNGILGWFDSNGRDEVGNAAGKIKQDWLDQEYADHQLNQVVFSTHSKTLIYKVFSLGKNFVVSDNVSSINYDDAENKLRALGLSCVINKVLFVEGDGDQEALEYLAKQKNITIKSLGGSSEVVDYFKKISGIRSYIDGQEFVFLVDSDNKGDEFFENLRSIDSDFYDKAFVKLDKHEFENYLLDSRVIKRVCGKYIDIAGLSDDITDESVRSVIVNKSVESLPTVYRKEISLHFNRLFERYFSEKIWGRKGFSWSSMDEIRNQLSSDALSLDSVDELKNNALEVAKTVFEIYESATDDALIDRCDGKQVLGKVCSYYSNLLGVNNKTFKKAVYKEAFSDDQSLVFELPTDIFSRFS